MQTKEQYKAWYEKNKEALLEKQRLRNKKNYEESKPAYRARAKKWAENNPDRLRELRKDHAEKNRDKLLERSKTFYKKNRVQQLADAKERKYARMGTSSEGVEAQKVLQQNLCAICGTSMGDAVMKRLVIDHCHKSGKARALLCHHCNVGLGAFMDSPERLKTAARYLESNPSFGSLWTLNSAKLNEL